MSDDQLVFHGVVRSVTFENDQTGYRVLRVEVQGQGTEIVVGSIPRVAPTMEVRVVGKRINDLRYGYQVQAESVTVVTPSTRLGIERFLASGLVRGLGARLAARIVEHFGDDTLKVLDGGAERLSEVKGVSKTLARLAGDAWASQKSQSSVLVFLHSHGVTPGLAGRIFRRYGPRTMEVVEQTPFRLAMEVAGVGFLTADRIARSVGIAPDAPERMEAGVVHWLHQMSDAGHIYVPRAELVERAARELATAEAPVDAAIDRAAEAKRLIIEGERGPAQRVFSAALYEAEVQLARMFTQLLREPGRPLLQAAKAIELFQKQTRIELAQAQKEAVEAAALNKVLIITGGPGVGKTTVVRAVLSLFELSKLDTQLCAPTGRAAKRLSESTSRPAQTIHRLLEVDPRTGRFLRGQQNKLAGDAFIVDETSMLDVPLARSLLDAIDPRSRLVLVGDVDQLPSVGPGALLRDAIASGAVPVVRLTHIFRQATTSLIVESAHLIRGGRPPASAEGRKGDFFIIPRVEPQKAKATILELVERRISSGFGLDPRRDVQVLTPMRKGDVGVESLNQDLQRALNPEGGAQVIRGGRTLRVGDKVMQLKNDYDRDVYNGDIGFVLSVDPAHRRVTVRIDDDREVEYDEEALDNLSLAYAVSIHKSQGSEYPAVVIPWLKQHYVMLSRNLLYTAVTRGKRLVVLVADPRAIEVALTEERREERRTTLRERLEEAVYLLRPALPARPRALKHHVDDGLSEGHIDRRPFLEAKVHGHQHHLEQEPTVDALRQLATRDGAIDDRHPSRKMLLADRTADLGDVRVIALDGHHVDHRARLAGAGVLGDGADHREQIATQRAGIGWRRGERRPRRERRLDHLALGRPAPIDGRLIDLREGSHVIDAQRAIAHTRQLREGRLTDGLHNALAPAMHTSAPLASAAS